MIYFFTITFGKNYLSSISDSRNAAEWNICHLLIFCETDYWGNHEPLHILWYHTSKVMNILLFA